LSPAWDVVAHEFHERVKASCWDTLAGQLAILHQPHIHDGLPVCRGCDCDERGATDPVWPCRTYTIIAATVLNISNVENSLTCSLKVTSKQQ
jgi:hypothetical protein